MDITLEQIRCRIHSADVEVSISKPNILYRGIRYIKKDGYLQISQVNYDCYVRGSNQDYLCFKNADIKTVFEQVLQYRGQ